MKIARELDLEIVQRVKKLEAMLRQGFQQFRKKLFLSQALYEFLHGELVNYKNKLLRNSEGDQFLARISAKMRADKELRFPHRKILDFLLGRYDFSKKTFQEVSWSVLVKQARVGKNMANDYLALLQDKGYVKQRTDGYRKFFKIQEEKAV